MTRPGGSGPSDCGGPDLFGLMDATSNEGVAGAWAARTMATPPQMTATIPIAMRRDFIISHLTALAHFARTNPDRKHTVGKRARAVTKFRQRDFHNLLRLHVKCGLYLLGPRTVLVPIERGFARPATGEESNRKPVVVRPRDDLAENLE